MLLDQIKQIDSELAKLEASHLSEKNRLYEEKWKALVNSDFNKEIYDSMLVDEVLEVRALAREIKNWKLSDDIRNYLDEKFIFVFDIKGKDGKPVQKEYCRKEVYFNCLLYYEEKYEEDGVTKLAEPNIIYETIMERVERFHNIKFKTKRQFVEWNIKHDNESTKMLDSWIYSMMQSVNNKL